MVLQWGLQWGYSILAGIQNPGTLLFKIWAVKQILLYYLEALKILNCILNKILTPGLDSFNFFCKRSTVHPSSTAAPQLGSRPVHLPLNYSFRPPPIVFFICFFHLSPKSFCTTSPIQIFCPPFSVQWELAAVVFTTCKRIVTVCIIVLYLCTWLISPAGL